MQDASRGKILITGAAGFVGSHLITTLSERFPQASLVLCDLVAPASKVGEARIVDITNPDSVESSVAETRPTTIVHLAALSSVGNSFKDAEATHAANVQGTSSLLNATMRYAPGCHFLFISSAEVYGESTSVSELIDEGFAIRPRSPYAESKAAAEKLVLEASGKGLHTTIVRPFNHTGPRQTERFVVPAFCSQIARIENGLQPPVIRVGELDDARDFLDVSDIVELYSRIVSVGQDSLSGLIVNACSGRAQRVGDILRYLLDQSNAEIAVEVDPARLRPNRRVWMVGNPAFAKASFGWSTTKPLTQTLDETLDYWRNSVHAAN